LISNAVDHQHLTRQTGSFAPVTFVTGTSSRPQDLKGKTVVVTQGTTNERIIKALSDKENLGIKFLNAKDHGESFLTVESGRAVAFSMDDILLYGLIAKSKKPKDFEVVGDYLSYDPYGIMFRRNDDDFGVVVRRSVGRLFASGDINKLYNKWFLEKLPSGERWASMSPLLKVAISCRPCHRLGAAPGRATAPPFRRRHRNGLAQQASGA
jgi:glutamate/aspartate transport system substrate-binding protein